MPDVSGFSPDDICAYAEYTRLALLSPVYKLSICSNFHHPEIVPQNNLLKYMMILSDELWLYRKKKSYCMTHARMGARAQYKGNQLRISIEVDGLCGGVNE